MKDKWFIATSGLKLLIYLLLKNECIMIADKTN